MRKALSFAFVFLLMVSVQAQEKKKSGKGLFYFFGKDSLVGVKDARGAVIIPARYENVSLENTKQPITDDVILLYDFKNKNEPFGYAKSMLYFDRNGRLLIHPFWFDNGPDYLEEGLMRFVEGNRMGFADRYGKIKLPAVYNYVSPFNYGLSFVCEGCTFYRDSTKDSEHNLSLTPGRWFVINKEGRVVKALTERTADDRRWDSLLLPLGSFTYTAYEQTILKKIEAVPGIRKYLVQHYSPLPDPAKMGFHIVEKPSARFPYYHIKAFGYWNGKINNIYDEFIVTKDGRRIFRYQQSSEPEPIEKWLAEARAYEKEKQKKKQRN